MTGHGRLLSAYLKGQIVWEFDRIELLLLKQIKAVEEICDERSGLAFPSRARPTREFAPLPVTTDPVL